MPAGEITLEVDGALAWITIDNRAKHNAMSLAMWRQLGDRLAALPPEARCLVVRGGGERAFVSGADISEFEGQRRSAADVAAYDRAADSAMELLHGCPIPTVAMIQGYCLGGGVALALCCDVRIAGDSAVFAVPAARLGLGYGWKGLRKLLDAVSVPVATDLMISARRIGALEAAAVGLIGRVVADATLLGETAGYAETVAENAPLTVRAVKRIIKELAAPGESDLALCERLVDECFASEDYAEGIRAFQEKRRPSFQGR